MTTTMDATPHDVIRQGDPLTRFAIRRYVKARRDGRRYWNLPEGTVLDPHFDYDRGVFVGQRDGRAWQAPWSAELTWHLASQIKGWCVPEQGQKLFDLTASSSRAGTIVEVGSCRGLSAAWIGWGAKSTNPDAQLNCVDTFQGSPTHPWKHSVRPDFEANVNYAGVADIITVHQGLSHDIAAAWDGTPISMLYIDAAHSYTAVKADFDAWSPYCPSGAIIAFDDCSGDFPGVQQLQYELLDARRLRMLGRASRMVFWQVP